MKTVITIEKIIISIGICFMLILFGSCKPDKADDSAKVADQVNDEKFEANESKDDDAEILVDWASLNLSELEILRLAEKKVVAKQLKEIIESQLQYHQNLQEEIAKAASIANVTIPNTLSDEGRDQFEELSRVETSKFDSKLVNTLKESHEEMIELANKLETSTAQPNLKKLAEAALPKLSTHLEHLNAVEIREKK